MITTRVLPEAEWPRLADTDAASVWQGLNPQHAMIVVAEEDGQIVGCHVALTMVHLHCWWIRPGHRKRATLRSSVGLKLWAAVREAVLQRFQATGAITSADNDEVRSLLEHVGAERLPGDAYIVKLGGG